ERLAAQLGLPELVRLSANENPLGPSPRVVAAITREAARVHLYPDGGAHALREALARRLGVRPEQLVFGNGADELLGLLALRGFLDALGADPPLVVLDEAYRDFADDPEYPDGVALLRRFPRLIVLRTFSKIAALAGLRVGYAVATAETCDRLNRVRAPYNVNRLGQVAALAALEDPEHWDKSRRLVLEERAFLSEGLRTRGYTFPPSQANFLLVKVPDAPALREKLLRAGILVRDGASVGFPGHLRISLGLRETNEKLLGVL